MSANSWRSIVIGKIFKPIHNKVMLSTHSAKIRKRWSFSSGAKLNLKNSHNSLIQWLVVSTSCQETKVYLNQKVGSRNTKIGPALEVTICCVQGKFGVEIRIKSVNKTILIRMLQFPMVWMSWSRHWASRSTTTTSRKLQRCSSNIVRWNRIFLRADQRLKQNPKDRASASSSTKKFYPLWKELRLIWTDLELQEHSMSDDLMSKKLINLVRQGYFLREDDEAIEFWRIKDNLRKYFLYCPHWSDEM